MSLRRARPTNAALAEELDLLPQRLVHERLGVCRHGTMTWGAGAVLYEFARAARTKVRIAERYSHRGILASCIRMLHMLLNTLIFL